MPTPIALALIYMDSLESETHEQITLFKPDSSHAFVYLLFY